MPELPEVETIVRKLHPILSGKIILSSELYWNKTLAYPSPAEFKQRVRSQQIKYITRRGKFLHIHLPNDNLLIHLRMSGDLTVKLGNVQPEKHDRLILSLSDDHTLVFNDTRKFGRIWLLENPDEILGGLGPEPLDPGFTAQGLFEQLQSRRRQLKPLLLDQAFIAGMGNIYTDEALHAAGLHPLTTSDSVSREEASRLWQAIRDVLSVGIEKNGASIDWVYRGGEFQNHFRVYGRKGEHCPVCGTIITRIVVGQRGTHVCPSCQPRRS